MVYLIKNDVNIQGTKLVIDAVAIATTEGDPNGQVDLPEGSLILDKTNNKWYKNVGSLSYEDWDNRQKEVTKTEQSSEIDVNYDDTTLLVEFTATKPSTLLQSKIIADGMGKLILKLNNIVVAEDYNYFFDVDLSSNTQFPLEAGDVVQLYVKNTSINQESNKYKGFLYLWES